jgi:hypothetical protein
MTNLKQKFTERRSRATFSLTKTTLENGPARIARLNKNLFEITGEWAEELNVVHEKPRLICRKETMYQKD